MIIEIQGTNFLNKGAELMLHTVLQEMRATYPEAKFVMLPFLETTSQYEKRAKLGLLQKSALRRHRIQWGNLAGILPQKIRALYGIVLDKEVDVVLDASGFAYSDQWSFRPTLRLAQSCQQWKKNGTKVVLLPQAFGPFTSKKIKDAIRIVVDNTDLIFARERVSYEHLIGIVGERPNIRIAPDFTNLIDGILPSNFDTNNNKFCIVPNYRMIDKTCTNESEAYLPFLIKCTKYLQDRQLKPFILVHEGANDLMLAENIHTKTGGNIPIVKEVDPLKIKGILGACEGTIGSRFHGLVSALSQGVPSLGTGWSHKYQMLFEDYGFPDGLIHIAITDELLFQKLDMIVNPETKNRIKQKLHEQANALRLLTKQIWPEVSQVI